MDGLAGLDEANLLWMLLDKEYSDIGLDTPTYQGANVKDYVSLLLRSMSLASRKGRETTARALTAFAYLIRLIMLSSTD